MTDDAQSRSLKRDRDDEQDELSPPTKLRKVDTIPPEVVEQTAIHLVSDHPDHPRDAQQNLTNFTLANRYIRNVVAGAQRQGCQCIFRG